jgi:hypothetical protein
MPSWGMPSWGMASWGMASWGMPSWGMATLEGCQAALAAGERRCDDVFQPAANPSVLGMATRERRRVAPAASPARSR